MVVWFMTFIIIFFQIILTAARGITLPMNAVTTKMESFRAEPGNVESPELENQPITRNDFSFIETQNVASLPLKLSTNSVLPKLEINYKMALAYGEECALKYGHYNKMQPTSQSVWKSPKQRTRPPIEPNILTKEPIKSLTLSPELKLPLIVASSVISLNPTEINTEKTFASISPPCIDSSAIETTSNSGLTSPLSASCTVISSEPTFNFVKPIELSKSQLPLSNPVSLESSLTLPVFCLSTDYKTSDIHSVSTSSLGTSTFTLPLSVTSSTSNLKLSQSNNPSPFSLGSNIPPLSTASLSTQLPLQIYYTSLVTSPNTLPNPLVPLPTPNQHSPLVLNPESCTSTAYKCPLVPQTDYSLPLISELYSNIELTDISSIDTKIDFSSDCNYFKPLPAGYNNMFTLPSPEISSQGVSCSSYYPNEFSLLYTSPPYLSGSLSAIENSLLVNPHKTSAYSLNNLQELDNTCASTILSNSLMSLSPVSASNSLSASVLPSPVPNCLLSPPFPASPTTTDNSYSATFKTDCKSFKRSYETSGKVFKSENQIPSSYISAIDHETFAVAPSTPNSVADKFSSSESIQKLLELIYLAELLNTNDSVCKWSVLNEIVSMLNVLEDVQCVGM